MKLLLQTALQSRRHFLLLLATLLFMLAEPISSQLEMLSLGVITKTSVDFFDLFADKGQTSVSLQQIEQKWPEIDTNNQGVITKKDAAEFIAHKKDPNLLEVLIRWVNRHFDLAGSYITLIIVLLCVAVFKAISIFGKRYFTPTLSIRVSRDLRQRYFEHIQTLPMSFYQQYNMGSLSSRIVADASLVATAINAGFTNYLQAPFTAISTFLLCVTLSWQLSLIIFLGLPLVGIPIVIMARRIKRVSKMIQKNQESFTSILLDFLGGIQTVKIFATESLSLRKYKEQNDRMAQLEEKSNLYASLARPILHLVGCLFLAGIILYGVGVLGMTIPNLIAFCGLLFLFYEPIKKFGEENVNIQRGVVAAERMFEVLHMKPEIADSPDAVAFTGSLESLEFQDVWFKYENDWVLRGVSFRIEKGQKFAIVGPTGSGKSTLALLIPRLWEVQKGRVLINGKPVSAYTQKSLRLAMAFVPQKPFLFLDTVKENICFGGEYSDEEMRRAAHLACAEEFIERLPQKYDTLLAETGKNLSGGQQQRLAIARALLKRAQLLVLDEATSSLDAISEGHIKEAMHEMKRIGMTQIVIAHRLSTIEDADTILYLERGHKIAEGPRDHLLATCPGFRTMWEMMQLPAVQS